MFQMFLRSYHLGMSLRKLAAESSLDSLRLWGKLLGTSGDYYVAEGTLPAAAALLLPADDVEPRGLGAESRRFDRLFDWFCL